MMKNKIIFLLSLCFVLVLSACHKDTQCKCIFDDVMNDSASERIIAADGLDCDDITEMAEERHVTTSDGTHALQRVEVHKVSCRSYGE